MNAQQHAQPYTTTRLVKVNSTKKPKINLILYQNSLAFNSKTNNSSWQHTTYPFCPIYWTLTRLQFIAHQNQRLI